ncbi:MAG: hypothetical protein LBE01_01800 [Deltaproteobacteria bacterium]|jgi:hypothetical protein|nr:hypothetical protein [Deltaproteobacteria bacterium]
MIENLNYNPLGLIGPLRPRPEYRPPSTREESSNSKGEPTAKKTASGQVAANPKEAQKIKSEADGRLNLATAQSLTRETSEAIANLPPEGRNAGPHRLNPYWGLVSPRYV